MIVIKITNSSQIFIDFILFSVRQVVHAMPVKLCFHCIFLSFNSDNASCSWQWIAHRRKKNGRVSVVTTTKPKNL